MVYIYIYIYIQTRIFPGEWDTQNYFKDIEIKIGHLLPVRRSDQTKNPTENTRRMKIKEKEKTYKYFDLARELYIKGMMIPIWYRGVIVIVVGNGHGDTSSNPGGDWWHFT